MAEQQRIESERLDEAAATTAGAGPPLTAVQRALDLQRQAGNRAVSQMVARKGFWDNVTAFVTGDYIATVKGEQVACKTEAEESEAEKIIDRIESEYGVDVSSVKSLKALQTRNKTAPKEFLDKLKLRPWLFKELVAVEKALKHFKKILGLNRALSTRKDASQEILSVGKMEEKFGKVGGEWKWKPTVLGEFFREDELRAFSMYKHGEKTTVLFASVEKELEATATHEIAHGVMFYALNGFMADTGYWLDRNTKTGTPGAEAPPTKYGDTNGDEDLAETVMLYFVDPDRLKNGDGAAAGSPGNPCPKRFAYIAKIVGEWTPTPPPPPVGDFPEPDPNATTAIA